MSVQTSIQGLLPHMTGVLQFIQIKNEIYRNVHSIYRGQNATLLKPLFLVGITHYLFVFNGNILTSNGSVYNYIRLHWKFLDSIESISLVC